MPINPLIPLSTPDLVGQVNTIDSINARRRQLGQTDRRLDQGDRDLSLAERQESRVQENQDAVTEERKIREAAIDAIKLRDALARDRETGNFRASRQILADRAKRLTAEGRDIQHTAVMGSLMNQGRFDEVDQFAQGVITDAGLRGLLPSDQQEGFTLRPGDVRFDAEGNRVAANENARTPLVEVSSGNVEPEADKAFGRTVGERAAERVSQAQEAQRQNAQFDRIVQALDRGADTGLGEETLLDIKGLASTLLGVQFTPEDNEQEVVRTISNEMALRLRNPDSGLGLTGNTSNRDLQFLRASVPGLQRSEGGNRLIISFSRKLNQLKTAVAREQSRIIRDNGGSLPGDLDAQMLEFVDNFELLTPEERRQIDSALQAEGPPTQADQQVDVTQMTDEQLRAIIGQ